MHEQYIITTTLKLASNNDVVRIKICIQHVLYSNESKYT